MILSVILSIVAILLMVTIHEFGHFLAGKLLKVPVYKFAIGMGPSLFEFKGKSETTYALKALPLGGFCAFDDGDITGVQDSNLYKQSTWKRFIIFVAGSAFNLLSAFLVAIMLCAFIGTPTETTRIDSIALEETDDFLQPGDVIKSINGINILNNFDSLQKEVSKSNGTIDIVVERNGIDVEDTISLIKYGDSYVLGVNIGLEYVKSQGIYALKDGFNYTVNTAKTVLDSFAMLITGNVKVTQMSGIVGAVSIMGEAAKQNLTNLVFYFVLLSVNLGIFNLFPIPALDGFKILCCVYEAIFKKRIPEKVEETLNIIFILLLIIFMIFITGSDIIKIIKN